MTQWTAFVGVTGVVLTLFLALARLSQSALPGDDTAALSPGDDTAALSPGDARSSPDDPLEPTRPDDDSSRRPDDRESGRDDAVRVPGIEAGVGQVPDLQRVSGPDAPSDTGDGATDPGTSFPAESTPLERADRSDPVTGTISTGALLANVALTQGLFGGVVAAAAVYFEIPASALGLSGTSLPAAAVGVAFGVVLWVGNELASALAESAGVAYDERLREMLAPDSAGGWVLLLGAVLPLIAGVEELLFRAAAIGVPAAAYGTSPWALAVVSSLAFALGHGAQGRVGVVVTGVMGFVLSAGFVLTGSLAVVVIAHYLVNALEFVVHEGLDIDRSLQWIGG